MKEKSADGKIDMTEYWNCLGLDPIVGAKNGYETKAIDKAYKRAALRAHPDKGGDSFKFKAVTDAYEIIMSTLQEEEEAKKFKPIIVKATIKKGPPGVGFGMVVVEDSKKGDVVVKDVLEGLKIVGKTDPEDLVLKKGDVLVGIDKDDINGWPLTRVVARLNNFRVPVGGTVALTFKRKVRIDGQEEREDKPDFTEEANPWDAEEAAAAPVVIPVHTGGGDDDLDDEFNEKDAAPFIPAPDPYAGEYESPEKQSSAPAPSARRRSSIVKMASNVAARNHNSVGGSADEMAAQIERLLAKNEDLEIENNAMKEKLSMAEASLSSLKREIEAAEETSRENAERAQHAEVEFQRVLLSTEEYHAARKQNNVRGEEIRKPPTTTSTTLKQARERAIAAVAATDPTGNMLRKWEREGESAEDKLKRLESRLAAKGLINVVNEPFTKESMARRRQSLGIKLDPHQRRGMKDLQQSNVMKSNNLVGAQQSIMKKKLNQKLKYRPNQDDLVKGGILRPGTTGRAYGSRAV
jgi:hypothetical protein